MRTSGIAITVLSALAFGLSGPMLKPLLDAGWSPGAAVVARIACAAVLLVILAIVVERRLPRVRRGAIGGVVLYGILGVALVQGSFVYALQTLPVGVTLMVQFLAPVLVIAWAWLVEHQAPSRLTLAGAVVALTGAAIVIDPLRGGSVDPTGLAWALLSMIGLAGFFILSRSGNDSVSNLSFGAAGMTVGAIVVGIVGVTGLLPLTAGATDTSLGSLHLPWFVPFAVLVIVATALPYTTAIAGVERIGATLASLVLLSEVAFGAAFAWLLLGQNISGVQMIGGAILLVGIALAHLGSAPKPVPASDPIPLPAS